MKKIRILAVIMAVLMIPFGLLFSCNKDKPDDNPDDSSGSSTPIVTQPVVTQPIDNDGSKSGYLMFFSFDEAKRGTFDYESKPYMTYFTTAKKDGVKYIVDEKGGADGKGVLLIQREGSAADGLIDIKASAVSGLSATHVVEFDIKVSEGLLGDGVTLYSRKEVSGACLVPFVTIKADGVYDGSGNIVYEFSGDKWVHIAVAVDDENLTYDLYVNGGKMTDGSAFTNLNYPAWSSQMLSTYRLSMATQTGDNTYVYIDNLSICDGTEPKDRDTSLDNLTYTDSFTESIKLFEANKDSVLKLVKDSTLDGKLKNSAYSTGASMDNTMTLVKLNTATGESTPLMFDYGVEMGLYNYGADFGGKTFVRTDENENEYFIRFNANRLLNLTTNITGTTLDGIYAVSGSETEPKVTVTVNNGVLDIKYYGALKDNKLTLYTDENMTEGAVEYTLFESAIPFDGKALVYEEDNFFVYICVDDFKKVAAFTIKTADADVSVTDATYVYEDGVLTVTAGGNNYTFSYADDKLAYGEGENAKTLVAYVDTSAEELGENEVYAVKYQNYSTGVTQATFLADLPDNFDPTQWQIVRFKYYVPRESSNFTFLFYIDTGNNPNWTESSKWSYYSKTIKQSQPGWYTFEAVISSMGGSRDPDMSRFTGKMVITTTGWTNGPAGNTTPNTPYDGYAIYVSDIEFITNRTVVVEGPDAEHENCTHMLDGVSTFLPVEERVEPTCTTIGYYVLKCSQCGATKVDLDKERVNALGHDIEGQPVLRDDPTCTSDGFTYQMCKTCGLVVTGEKIPATGHNNYTTFDPNTNTMIILCKVCGAESSFVLDTELMSAQDKESALNLPDNQKFLVYEGNSYANFTVGSFESAGGETVKGLAAVNPKNSVLSAVQLPDGTYTFKYERGEKASDAYMDMNVNDIFQTDNHVLEFSLMLGAQKNGKYPVIASNYKDRNSLKKDAPMFDVKDTGVLTFKNDTSCTVALSETEFTNFALVIKPSENAIDVYVNGYLKFTGIPLFTDTTIDASAFKGNDFRFSYVTGNTFEGGQCFYINNLFAYKADMPINIVGVGDSGASSNEYVGDIVLKNPDKTDNDGSVSVTDSDVELLLPDNTKTFSYVFGFTLTADNLGNGKLLSGKKIDAYGFENVLDLLTVKDGYIYFLDIAICEASDAADGLNIVFYCDDVNSGVTVTVNGEVVPGGAISYPDGYYGLSDSYIIGWEFKSEVGSYEVSDIDMHTGLE